MTFEAFRAKYPLGLLELIVSPLVFRRSVLTEGDLPWPGMAHLRDLAEYAGYTYGALRTALSRAVSAGDITAAPDPAGKTRYFMSGLYESINRTVVDHAERRPGLTVAAFSFKTAEEKRRAKLKQMLGWFGFTMLTQNVYVTGALDPDVVWKAAADAGLAENLYLFGVPDGGGPRMAARLAGLFDVDRTARAIRELIDDMKAFVGAAGDAADFGRRIFYLGPVQHDFTFTRDVPLHKSLLPADYPIEELVDAMRACVGSRFGDLIEYYVSLI